LLNPELLEEATILPASDFGRVHMIAAIGRGMYRHETQFPEPKASANREPRAADGFF
jgi:hypothetical protein